MGIVSNWLLCFEFVPKKSLRLSQWCWFTLVVLVGVNSCWGLYRSIYDTGAGSANMPMKYLPGANIPIKYYQYRHKPTYSRSLQTSRADIEMLKLEKVEKLCICRKSSHFFAKQRWSPRLSSWLSNVIILIIVKRQGLTWSHGFKSGHPPIWLFHRKALAVYTDNLLHMGHLRHPDDQ